jgi:excisionase family DNA binding protein
MNNVTEELTDLKEQVLSLREALEAKNVTDFLTSNEVMKWMKISRPTVHRWKIKGVLVAYNVGGKVLFKRSEILEMVEGSKMVA